MNINDFKKLAPYFKNVEVIILEGWGESLLHKNLIEAIKLIKTEGSQAGFVTSGKGLTKKYISEIIDGGVDFVGFSFAGSSATTHESVRVNSNFGVLFDNIKTFNEIKADKKLNKPKLHIVYLMLKENIFEVPSLINFAKDMGIDEIILTNPIHITNEWQERQRVFRCGEKLHDDFQEILNEAEIKAKELKINLRRPSLSSVKVAVCEENPLKNLYISVDGEVSPCVYLYPPVSSPFKRIFCGNEHQIEKVSFGNIFREPFYEIWNKKEYIDFRKSFILRKKGLDVLTFSNLFLNIERLKRLETVPLSDPPEQCRTCHKMLGV